MAYIDVYQQAREENFLQKLTVAVVEKAQAVYVAGGGNLNLAQYEDALVVYAGPRSSDFRRFAEEFAGIVLAVNGTLTSASADSAFDSAVNAAWVPFAKLAEAKGLITLAVP